MHISSLVLPVQLSLIHVLISRVPHCFFPPFLFLSLQPNLSAALSQGKVPLASLEASLSDASAVANKLLEQVGIASETEAV